MGREKTKQGESQIEKSFDQPKKIADQKKPFSQEVLNYIFKVSPKDPNRVISRESSVLEFKESFGWKSLPKYLKTCAAFANAKGGYIVFGVTNRPHKLVGLTGSSLKLFEDISPDKMTENFNDHFSPEVVWDMHEHELEGKTYGLLYVHESKEKPVVCIRDAEKEIKEGDIFYRYRGRSERIKYPELKVILDYKRDSEQRLWMRHLLRIARIGVRDTGIFDLHSGQVTGTHGSFLIDESLLSQLSFIKEGEFSEVRGKPTLKLIGNVETITDLPATTGRKQIVKTKGIRIGDIVLAFLKQQKVEEPLEYIKQICFESTAFLPVYYFISLAAIDVDAAIELVNNVVSRSPARSRLSARIQEKITQRLSIPDNESESSKKKKQFVQEIKQKTPDLFPEGKELEYCLQAVRGLTPDEVKHSFKYICERLNAWFNRHYASAAGPIADNLRRAVCWIDEAVYMEEQR